MYNQAKADLVDMRHRYAMARARKAEQVKADQKVLLNKQLQKKIDVIVIILL